MGPRVVLGVGGGIAAYKACELLRLLTESGHRVRVVPTAAALRFVGEPTWAALSGQPVVTDVFSDVHEVPHVRIGQAADLVVVAPATADLLARAACGLADDLLTSTLLTARCPVLYAPAMHTEMWRHPATQANIATLRSRGAMVLEPGVGRLTGADSGPGRLPPPSSIFEAALRLLPPGQGTPGDDPWAGQLRGRRVVVTAGGTREPIDPVRFIGNRSSGKQGYAFAHTAAGAGASVTLITANVALPDPAGVEIVRVETTAELRAATLAAARNADVVVMAAAPSDFRPAAPAQQKIKKLPGQPAPTLALVENPDIAAAVGTAKPPGQVLVTFAAETATAEAAVANGRAKLHAKLADLIVINEVGPDRGFGADRNAAVVLGADGSRTTIGERPKTDLARAVWDLVVARLPQTG
ncbi:MAG: bifunctional phosphopantothenoylcysteine decarboxylase/phosphopantothenate--cysteine ligase CoaBC [Dactylosporangium sp.]|nr:bifunctional phosphopantothenoylcysteine decarboxylase/phosphopantothenate--cysteine ligase CoaBC [Dactylosporangium sp.]NNJ59985.1 bifunctional phosphopantothenoylcysteine decarboxylase/phosphopantothenate--cysteine ligase CoaBC [Dactylosporangium sp.]